MTTPVTTRRVTRRATRATRAAMLAALMLCGLAGARGQQPGAAPGKPAAGGGDASAAALVKKITDDLASVDKALQEATDADAAKGPLEHAREGHMLAIRDIEELLKQVKDTKSKQSKSGGSSQDKSSGGVSGKPPPRESDESSAPRPQGGKSQAQKDKEAQEAAQKEKDQPAGGGKDRGKPQQQEGQQPPPQDPLGRFQRTDTDARWGLLPPKMQERLMNLHVDDVPERYRAWLESYIHALNRLEEQGGGASR